MKLFTTTLLTALIASQASFGATLKEGEVMCLSKKYLEKYLGHVQHEEGAFSDLMLERAQCRVINGPMMVSKEQVVGDFVKLQTPKGFKVWSLVGGVEE